MGPSRIAGAHRRLKDVIRDTWKDTLEQARQARLLLVAGSLAYTTILSIIPLLAVSFAIFNAFGGMERLYSVVEPFILENLAEGADAAAMQWFRTSLGNIKGGAVGAGGLVALIITSMMMCSSFETAINHVWHAPQRRPFFQRVCTYWFFITLGPLALAVVVGAATSQHHAAVTQYLPGGNGIFVLTIAAFYAVFKYVPHRRVHWRPALISALVTAVLWNLARVGYALYTKRAVSYDKIYGSLSAVPILLLWIYIVWLIVLTGASLSAALQKRLELKP